MSDPWHCLEPGLTITRQGEDPEWVGIEIVNSYALELDAMARAIAGEPGPLLGRDDALGQAQTIDALYRAAGGAGLVAV